MMPVREFARYLNRNGEAAYVLPPDIARKDAPYAPYIYTEDDILTIWDVFDHLKPRGGFPVRQYVIPAMVKLMYCCGLRPAEARKLRVSDVDLEIGRLNIMESKKHRGRIVMMAEDVTQMLSDCSAIVWRAGRVPILETDPTHPTNCYGETKLSMERMFYWASVAHGIHFVALRYFNACGAHMSGKIGEAHNPETHLIPIVLQVPNGQRDHVSIFGDDYPTRDGTCVRDYIHVTDLASAHILAAEYLMNGGEAEKRRPVIRSVCCAWKMSAMRARFSHSARQNLRVMPVTVDGQPWGFQYSPYVYYNEHAIVMNTEHTPMVIDQLRLISCFHLSSNSHTISSARTQTCPSSAAAFLFMNTSRAGITRSRWRNRNRNSRSRCPVLKTFPAVS